MANHRLWNTVLFFGFGTYIILCIVVQTLLFKQYASVFNGAAYTNLAPFSALSGGWGTGRGLQMPFLMWMQLAVSMIPFGLGLFLWVTDCTSLRSIIGIALGFTGALSGMNFLLTAPVFDIDFMVSGLCGTLTGYGIAVIGVELLITPRIRPMLSTPSRNLKKVS